MTQKAVIFSLASGFSCPAVISTSTCTIDSSSTALFSHIKNTGPQRGLDISGQRIPWAFPSSQEAISYNIPQRFAEYFKIDIKFSCEFYSYAFLLNYRNRNFSLFIIIIIIIQSSNSHYC